MQTPTSGVTSTFLKRPWTRRVLVLIGLAILSRSPGCGLSPEIKSQQQRSLLEAEAPNDLVLMHGAEFRLDARGARAEALLVQAGRVRAAGDLDKVMADLNAKEPNKVRHLDLGGGVVVPGLQDAHGHIEGYGQTLDAVDLMGVASFSELIERVAERAGELPAGTWITGRGWDHTLWPGARFPEHGELSRAVPDHPVLLSRVDGHAALANANALRLAGLDGTIANTRPMPGGEILVDEEQRATGVFVDTAMGLVRGLVPDPDWATRKRHLVLAQEALLSVGLTCVHDMGVSPSTVELMEELRSEGLLRMRAVLYLAGNDGLPDNVLARYPRPEDQSGAGRLSVRGVKLMVDGALGSRGAALLRPYDDRSDSVGLMRFEEPAFTALVERYARAGLQPATHAIGDRANRMVLNAYATVSEAVPHFTGLRPRIEHAQVVSAADWARFDGQGIQASVQPTHATTDMRWAEERVGSERILGAYAWRKLTSVPRELALGSDFPVERPNPLEGIYAARTRRDRQGRPGPNRSGFGFFEDQCLSGEEALAGFTSGAARAVGQEATRGKLHPGFAADMVWLDEDPVTCAPAELWSTQVMGTAVDGEWMYLAPSSRAGFARQGVEVIALSVEGL